MAKEKKQTKASVILATLLAGAASIDEVATKACSVLGLEKPQALKAQVKGILAHIKKGKMKKWQAYKVDETAGIKVVTV